MRRSQRLAAAALALYALTSSGCFGSFAVTRGVYKKNESVHGRAAREGIFVGLLVVPVYEVAVLADMLIFNTIELFTGDNPLQDRFEEAEGSSEP